jgi:hypothetical protein
MKIHAIVRRPVTGWAVCAVLLLLLVFLDALN